jgi:MFS transporter, putative metabolite:H+ symporter
LTMSFRKNVLTANVIVSALGYFVDIYDLLLFGIVRVPSLKDLGVANEQLLDKGVFLLNSQMAGLLTGGIIWGILGDKRGRLSVLFGSIFLYSAANIANAFVTNVEMYGLLRFIAGIGLAGELGAAITLVSETLATEFRGYGTTIVASIGILGAVVGALIGDFFTWQTAYLVGGAMGLALLILRVSMFESGMFHSMKKSSIRRGDVRMLLHPRRRFLKYLRCILIGVPIWFVIGILVTFSPELARELGVEGAITAGKSIMWSYIGLACGDLASGWLSQIVRSRRKVLAWFIGLTAVLIAVYVFGRGMITTPALFYGLCVLLGFATGYWAVFVTNAAEQFGTNLRATVTTTAPNFVRGSVVPVTLAFQALKPHTGVLMSALYVGLATIAVAFAALYYMDESFGRNLDYLES